MPLAAPVRVAMVCFARLENGDARPDEPLRQVAHEQQLPVSAKAKLRTGTHPHPLLGRDQIIRATAVEPHVLFEKPEHVLDGEGPQIHPAHGWQKDAG